MSEVIYLNVKNLPPVALWRNFMGLCSVPHPSKKEEKIREYVVKFGKNLGLETIVDEVGNVIIRKPGTKGKENLKGIILQGHLDMVPQKNTDTVHDFEKDPISLRIDGEWVKAKGTTLGADNGIGVAAAMTILESNDIEHGPIECLFTIDEETGMTGAFGLKSGLLKGDILLNLDSEDEGELYIGCAGGINTSAVFKYKEDKVIANSIAYIITVKGLKGGHSGLDINLGRGNSNKIMIRLLWLARKKMKLQLASIEGGNLRNAIPRETFATIVIPATEEKAFNNFIKEYSNYIKDQYLSADPDLNIVVTKTNLPTTTIDETTANNLINAVYGCPNGVIGMSVDIPELVETSSNLAVVKSEKGNIEVMCLLRSSVEQAKDDLANQIECVFSNAGAKVEHSGGYPGWKPNVTSEILTLSKLIYHKLYKKEPAVKAIHAGLECGLLGTTYPKWDMLSFGPTIRSPHSPDERVNIPSVEKFWNFLINILKSTPIKK
ncbi:MAG: cytosol nonspecific dipeptidase [Bacteroidetes bacterium CG2_30_32_10]|nr:MAG: cytosol nonspecific dipeptidase [Bacteroidetes bacterium CG2_30_32_10]